MAKAKKTRYILVADFCDGCRYLKENFKPEGFEYVDLKDPKAEELINRVNLGDEFAIPLAIECEGNTCRVCKVEVEDGKVKFNCA